MLNRTLGISILITLLLTGCATPKRMASLGYGVASDKPVFLMTVTLKNAYRPFYQPRLLYVNVERKEVKDSADRFIFMLDRKATLETDAEAGNTYLVRMELENGDYVIRGLTGQSGKFPVRGNFFAPLHADLKSTGTGVFYLGHVAATVRERKEGEFRAGPLIPAIDQAVTGFADGTFDIEITDQSDKDEPILKTLFPALSSATIQKNVLPSFDRAKAQQWWEAH